MDVRFRLKTLMDERQLRVDDLEDISGVDRKKIIELRQNWRSISRVHLRKLVKALRVRSLDELLVLYDDDVWSAIRHEGNVTFHFGINSFPAADGIGADARMSREFVGSWDLDAFFTIWRHLAKTARGILLGFEAHVTGTDRRYDAQRRGSPQSLFEGGSHVVIGSPVANQFAEEVVCHCYGVTPYSVEPETAKKFPYIFAWGREVKTVSSFATQTDGPVGILSTADGKLVARRTWVPIDKGEDCALVVTYRVPSVASQTGRTPSAEQIVIVILGHGGPGTLAAARAIVDDKWTAEFFPSRPGEPRMRVVKATYNRRQKSPIDNRELLDSSLEPESAQPNESATTTRHKARGPARRARRQRTRPGK